MTQHIKRNRARCRACGSIIESRSCHDYVSCECGGIAVDGGREYLRRTATELDDIEEMSEYEDDGREQLPSGGW